MPPKYPSWYKLARRTKDYLEVKRFKRNGKQMVGVFKRRAYQAKTGKKWVTQKVKNIGLKSYSPVRSFQPIGRAQTMSPKNWSFRDNLKQYAEKIVKGKKVQMLRVRIEGVHDGKRRVFTSYVRFSPKNKNFLSRSKKGGQRAEYVGSILARTALSKMRSLGYSSSPESKRNLEEGDSKKNGRFFVQKIRVDSVQ